MHLVVGLVANVDITGQVVSWLVSVQEATDVPVIVLLIRVVHLLLTKILESTW